MGRYDSPYYNPERYYDPTAGAALMSVIRSEKKKYSQSIKSVSIEKRRTDVAFVREFVDFYGRSFGLRQNGKPRRLSNYRVVLEFIKIYQYCMDHAEDDDFSIENTVEKLDLDSSKKVEQVFSGRGNMGKLIGCYKDWMRTGNFQWKTKDGYVPLH